MNREKLMREVQMYGFALYDTGLFLDTHPTNKAALAFYEEIQKKYVEAVAVYEEEFGPLTMSDTDTEKGWVWVETPWPWEMEE